MNYTPRDLRDPPPTPRELSERLESAKVFDEAALQALKDAEQAYTDGLLTASAEQLGKLAAAKATAQQGADQSRARTAEADRLLKAATDPALLSAQRKRRTAAIKKTTEARELFEARYTEAAETLRTILRALAEAQAAVDIANSDPTDERLPAVEAFRSTQRAWKETVAETEVMLWRTVNGVNQPLPPEDQGRVQPNPCKGSREHRHNTRAYGLAKADELAGSGTLQTSPNDSIAVVQQRYRRLEVLPDQLPYQARPLAEELVLPAVYAGSSAPWPAMSGTASPDRVLAELAKPAQPRPVTPERVPMVEYEPIFNRLEPTPAAVVYGAS